MTLLSELRVPECMGDRGLRLAIPSLYIGLARLPLGQGHQMGRAEA